MSGDGTNAFNGFGGGPYPYPFDVADYDPERHGCPMCGMSVMIETTKYGFEVHCQDCGWFDDQGRPINEEAPQ